VAPSSGQSARRSRRGRPPEAEREPRRQAALAAAAAEITERGYAALTMLAVARRAGSSKESLYAWFGSKDGMVAELIRQQAAQTNQAVEAALRDDREPRDVLRLIVGNLLDLLVGETSLALNRAAMASPELATVLLRHGRHTTGPLVERYLAKLARDGIIDADDPAEAFRLLYGLVIQDTQIRALLGEEAPTRSQRTAQAEVAVGRFLALTTDGRTGAS
jgi:AcrR family transcriptional regulator